MTHLDTQASAPVQTRKTFGLAGFADASQLQDKSSRKRIMSVLRQACRVMSSGQKSRIGRLSGGAAIGAIVAGFSLPAMAQSYSAGGGSVTSANGVAIGPGTTNAGDHTVVIGSSATANAVADNSVSIGILANASAFATVAVGPGVKASADYSAAIGNQAIATGIGSLSVGSGSQANSLGGIALGNNALTTSIATNAVAIGRETTASAANTTALGSGGPNAAAGVRATAAGATAIGGNATAGAAAIGRDSIAIGGESTAASTADIAIGLNTTSNSTTFTNVAIGRGINNTNVGNSVAVGGDITLLSGNSIAIGGDINVDANSSQSIFLGNKSTAGNYALNTSIRSINLLTDGNLTTVTDSARAVTIDTTASTTASFSGNSGSLIIRTASPDGTGTSPGGISNATNSVLINAANPGATVTDVVSIGRNSLTSASSSIAIGTGAQATGASSISIGTGNIVSGAQSGAIGDPTTITGTGSYSLGNNNNIAANRAFALGSNISIAAGRDGSVGIGNASTVAAPNTGAFTLNGGTAAGIAPTAVVSVGSATAPRQITNVAAAVVSATSLDAVNGSQLFTTATALNKLGSGVAAGLGGGAGVAADGTVTNPTYNIGGTTFNNVNAALEALETATGGAGTTKYFNVNSTLADSSAAGLNSVAVGPAAQATGANAVAIGSDGTAATGAGSVAIGQGQKAQGVGSVAIGDPSTVIGTGAVGVGASNTATGNGAIAIGELNSADGIGAVTIGEANTATGNGTLALGNSAVANGVGSIAQGNAAKAEGPTSVAIGSGAKAGVVGGLPNNTAIGSNAQATGGDSAAYGVNAAATGKTSTALGFATTASNTDATAVGNAANAGGTQSTAIGVSSTASATRASALGNGARASASDATALGVGALATGANSVASGNAAAATADNTTAVGSFSVASGSESSAFGLVAKATGANSTAIGLISEARGANSTAIGVGAIANGASTFAAGDGANAVNARDVALGAGSVSAAPHSGAFTLNGGTAAGTAPTSVVSVGAAGAERQIQNVAAGVVSATSTDAINGSQLFIAETAINNLGDSLETVTGGGLIINPNGTIATPPTINAAGATFANTTAAIEALNTGNNLANTGIATAIGGGMAIAPNGTVTAPTFNVNGTNHTTVADALQAAGAGFNFTTAAAGTGTVAGTSVATVGAGETLTITAGNNLVGTQAGNGVALALNPVLTGITSMAVTGGATIDGTGINMNGDKITNLGAGSTAVGSTDAINGGQLNTGLTSVATNLGGGSIYDPATGTVTAPTYTVQGSTYTNVGTALGAIDSNLSNVLSGTAGLVQQVGGAPGTGQITVGAATGGTTMSVAGTGGNRVITGVAAGALAPTSVDAVNGGQVNTLSSSIATNFGGGSTFDPATGEVTAPTYTVAGSTYNNVGDAISSLANGGAKTKYFNVNSTLPDSTAAGTNSVAIGPNAVAVNAGDVAIGFGAASAAPHTGAFTLNGGVAAAIAPTSVVSIGAAGNERQLQNVAAGVVSATSTDAINGSQLFTVATAANNLGNSLETVTGGGLVINPDGTIATAPTINVGGVAYNTTTAAIEAGDAKADKIGDGLVDALGGGATVAPDGTVTGPTYALGGNSYTNVGAALGALANGAVGPVQYANAATPTTPNGGVPTNNLTLVGAAAGPVTLDNVANGSTLAGSTQAINGGQLNTGLSSVATNLGGGSTYDPTTGTVTAPTYNIAGNSYTTVGDAFTATNTAVTNLANGTSGLVQQVGGAPGSGTITVGAATGGTLINVAGTEGNRKVTGVAPAMLSATSADAVNGSQLFALGTSTAENLGGGSTFDPATGKTTAPVYNVAGNTYNTVGGALTAVDAKVTNIANGGAGPVQYSNTATPTTPNGGTATNDLTLVGANSAAPVTLHNVAAPVLANDAANKGYVDGVAGSLAAATLSYLGGGSQFSSATGTTTGPNFQVGGQNYTTVADALEATNALGVQYVADADGNPTNAVALSGARNGQPVTVSNVAAGTRPTDAVNVGQLQQGLAGANAYTDAKVGALWVGVDDFAKKAYAGTAAAIALQTPIFAEPGSVAMRVGTGQYRGQWAFGGALRATADNGRWSVSAGVSGGPNAGVAVSAGVDFRLD
jgi:trimeric autotransporter adhesin